MVCHSRAANFVLGPSTEQMNRDHDYGGVVADQLRTLEHLGVFRVSEASHLDEIKAQLRDFGDVIGGGVRKSLAPLRAHLPAAPAPARALLSDAGAVLSATLGRLGKEAYKPQQWAEGRVRERGGYTALLPKPPSGYARLVDPSDAREGLEARARSYLHANCSQCHVEAGGGNALMELEFTTPRERMRVIGAKPQHNTF